MNRRGFLSALGAFAATAVLDPEMLLWKPGAKTIFAPKWIPTEPRFYRLYVDVAGSTSGTVIYKWQKSVDGGIWVDSEYSIGAVAQQTAAAWNYILKDPHTWRSA